MMEYLVCVIDWDKWLLFKEFLFWRKISSWWGAVFLYFFTYMWNIGVVSLIIRIFFFKEHIRSCTAIYVVLGMLHELPYIFQMWLYIWVLDSSNAYVQGYKGAVRLKWYLQIYIAHVIHRGSLICNYMTVYLLFFRCMSN